MSAETPNVPPTPIEKPLQELSAQLTGDVDSSDQTRYLYSTDASIYQVQPAGVVAPATQEDVQAVVNFARKHDTSVVARGAGSSLTGNAVGEGIVVDTSRYLDEIVEIDAESETVRVQPGVVLDELNDILSDYGLYFPPDPSTSSTCTIGGMVANDAAGPHSVKHGTTRENVRAVECVLADGRVVELDQKGGDALTELLDEDTSEGRLYREMRDLRTELDDEIASQYPDVERNSSGYDLQSAAAADGSWMDLANLIIGSEGTLAFISEVTLELTERPETRAATLCFYEDVISAAAAVAPALRGDPSAVELIDDTVLGYAREAWGLDLIPEAAGAALLIEVETTPGEQTAALQRVIDAADTEACLGRRTATTPEEQDRLWKVRKASNPLLNRRSGDEQALSFIEDAAIPPERLPEYLRAVREILMDHNLDASVFGHAGQGVLHIKPFLNLKTDADKERLRAVSNAVHETVLEFGGCVSGEHGDGRLRSTYLESMYGSDIYAGFKRIKNAFDPNGVFNPGNVVPGEDTSVAKPDEDLRYDAYAPSAVETALDFTDEEGFESLIEQCNGCSKCRTSDDGVMCPSYRASEREVTSTRGRANALRGAINGELGRDALTDEWFQSEVLDLCLSCKACETECPTGVDMSKLKTEAKHQKHEEDGVPLRSRVFGHIRKVNKVGSRLAPIANPLREFALGRFLLEKVAGIDRRRELPAFASQSFMEWFDDHTPASTAGTRGQVALFPDCYMAYNHPEVGTAAVSVLEAFGYDVILPDVNCCGRPALSQGLVEHAQRNAATNTDRLREYAREGIPVIAVEPSCTSALKEYDDLLDDTGGVPDVSETVASFLYDRVIKGDLSVPSRETEDKVAFHGHCHSKAKGWDHAPVALLRHAGYDVTPVNTTCCGMAGAFGYETEHYELSMTIGDELEADIETVDADRVAAPGASCGQQLDDRDLETEHPMELLAEVIV